MTRIPKAASITHLHILAVLNTLIPREQKGEIIRILDAGCGDGKLIAYLHTCLSLLHPDKSFHISGYDVHDHGVQSVGFLQRTVRELEKNIPTINWSERIHAIQANDRWAFSSDRYMFIVSNQVLEHVHNKDLFFSNIYSNLNEGGYSIHLAPLEHVVHEGHIYLPFAHRIRNYSALYGYIRLLSSLGIGKFLQHKRAHGCTLDEFSERHADYMYFWTSYSSESETLDAARRQGLRADFRFSIEFYISKLRQSLGLPQSNTYKYRKYGFLDAIFIKFLRYLSSATLVCQKKNIY